MESLFHRQHLHRGFLPCQTDLTPWSPAPGQPSCRGASDGTKLWGSIWLGSRALAEAGAMLVLKLVLPRAATPPATLPESFKNSKKCISLILQHIPGQNLSLMNYRQINSWLQFEQDFHLLFLNSREVLQSEIVQVWFAHSSQQLNSWYKNLPWRARLLQNPTAFCRTSTHW